ncbi:recombinase family protein [Acutalibacter muris]|jgi:site-specific DNA recombinase|nr:recombinase family protein [Acutalibacter muris]
MKNTSIIPNHVSETLIFNRATGWREDMPAYIEPGTRVLCLYRVSTDKQLYHTEDNEADIPMQRKRCRKYCESMNWTIVCELQEEGVSGHKVRAENRDKIQQIKEYAKQGKFDILLVFMFDRIGRISDETPFVVEWFVRNGIRVWSTQEGEQRFDSHTDKLTNYIRFWQADGESEKTSIRTANSMGLLTEEGCFTGGCCPYGYSFVKTGRTNKRRQEVNDLAICEQEAEVVRIMFQLAAKGGYGAQRIANYLNGRGIKNHSGKNWHPASIQGMLRNILYTGVLRSGKSRSEPLERLKIVDEREFQTVQEMLAARSRANEKIRSKPLNTRGKSLLSGNIFCGHCGARLCVTTSGKGRKSADGTDTIRMRYTCQTKSRTHGDCDGQTGYTVEKLDGIIDIIIHTIFDKVSSLSRDDILAERFAQDCNARKTAFESAKKEYEKAETELKKLKSEIIKSISGESAFAPELLNSIIQEQEQKCDELKKACLTAQREWEDDTSALANMGQQYDDILEWSAVYDHVTMPAKKVIVSHIIERVDVFRGYRLKLQLNLSVEQFLRGLDCMPIEEKYGKPA